MPLKFDVEADNLVFQDVGHRLRVGDDALYCVSVESEPDTSDHRGERVGQELDDLPREVLAILDKNVRAFSLLRTPSH